MSEVQEEYLYNYINDFADERYDELWENGFFSIDDVDDISFIAGLIGFIIHNLATIDKTDVAGIMTPISYTSIDDISKKVFSTALVYAFTVAGFNYNNPLLQACNLPSSVFMIGPEDMPLIQDEIKQILQQWHDIDGYLEKLGEDSNIELDLPSKMVELAVARQNEILKYGYVESDEVDRRFLELLDGCDDCYPEGSIVRDILDDVMFGELGHVFMDAAGANAIVIMADMDIALRKEGSFSDGFDAVNDGLTPARDCIEASKMLNPKVNDRLLFYFDRLANIYGNSNWNVVELPVIHNEVSAGETVTSSSSGNKVVLFKDFKSRNGQSKNQPKG